MGTLRHFPVRRKIISWFVRVITATRSWRQKFIARIRFGNSVRFGNGIVLGPNVTIRCTDGGRVTINDRCIVSDWVEIVAKGGTVSIGASVFIGRGCVIVARDSVQIGSWTQIAEYVTIRDQDHLVSPEVSLRDGLFVSDPVTIGNSVWVGAKATITRGVSVGDGSVIGAGAVVTRDVPEHAVSAGVPARVIRNVGRS